MNTFAEPNPVASTPAPMPSEREMVERLIPGSRANRIRAGQGHRRPEGSHRTNPDRVVRRRPLPDHRRAGPGQDAAGQIHRPDLSPEVPAHSVHAGPDAGGHHRHRDPSGDGSTAGDMTFVHGPGLRQHHPGRRNQPHAAQDAGGAARSDAGTSGHRRRRAASAGGAVLRAGDAEPDRDGRHLSAARGPAGPVHVQCGDGLPAGGRRSRVS